MAKLFGNQFTKRELLSRMGEVSQVAGISEGMLIGSNGTGVRTADFRTGSGLNFTVLPGRGMDIAQCDYKGMPLAWMSPAGVTSPMYYEEPGDGWLRGFIGGLLTTGGMTYCGSDCVDKGEALGVHGRSSNYTAEDVGIEREWIENEYQLSIKGKIRQAALYKENLRLSRTISARMGESIVKISDTIENMGFDEQPLMMLYHINFGWPVVSENSRFVASCKKTIPRPGQVEAENEPSLFAEFTKPETGYIERCYYHHLQGDKEGNTMAMLANDELGLGVYVKYNINQLFNLVEWKQMSSGIYAVGIEPTNCYLEGRNKSREDGTLQFIKPGEIRTFEVEIGVLDGINEIKQREDIINNL